MAYKGYVRFFAALSVAAVCSCAGLGSSRGDGGYRALARELASRRSAKTSEQALRIAALEAAHGLPDIRRENLQAAAEAMEGRLRVASAAWWGWNRRDSTAALNGALKAPVDLLIVPAMDGPWLVGPLRIDGPKTIIFEAGCVVQAGKGAFLGKTDSLISVRRAEGLTLSGYGATLRMRGKDYRQAPYEASQWRHAVSLRESVGILVEGLTIEDSGGDGVYIGQDRGGVIPHDIVLRDLDLRDNHRQGVSVISAYNFRMEYCRVRGTRGTAPQAGIDFEPNSGVFGLALCVVHGCLFERNAGAAVHVHLEKMSGGQAPVSIVVEESALIGSPLAVWVGGLDNGVRGSVVFRDSVVRGLVNAASGDSFQAVFSD